MLFNESYEQQIPGSLRVQLRSLIPCIESTWLKLYFPNRCNIVAFSAIQNGCENQHSQILNRNK